MKWRELFQRLDRAKIDHDTTGFEAVQMPRVFPSKPSPLIVFPTITR